MFIVDACLALDAGSKDPPPDRGRLVRAFLTALLEAGHLVGFTSSLEGEWKKHAARFARRWLATMRSRRRVERLAFKTNVNLLARVLGTAGTDAVVDAMEKDWHLVEAALATDRTISSSDDSARASFCTAAVKVASLKAIVWVNPSVTDLVDWVCADAPSDPERRLG